MNNEKKTDNNFQALCVKRAKMVAMAITFIYQSRKMN